MLGRREFLQVAGATIPLLGSGLPWSRAMAQQKIRQDDVLSFDGKGQVTLLHLTDLHAQLAPVYFREPSVNIGVGEAAGREPHITGKALLERFGIEPGSVDAYLYSDDDFAALAGTYGRVGGLDRVRTIVEAVRAERPDNTLLLDGGDTWHGSWPALQTRGEDMIRAMALLAPDAMTAHWEFTLGAERVKELIEGLSFPFLAQNVRDTDWEEPVFERVAYFERSGVKVAVIGQAFPYTPIANPRWMFDSWSFGIREEELQELVDEARDQEGAGLVVLLSHNGFDVDHKLASRVRGIDVILTAHTHDAIPAPVLVGKTILVGSGSNGKFVARLDLDVGSDRVKEFGFKLMPILSDVIEPDPEMAALVEELREPYAEELSSVIGRSKGTLYRRGNFNGTIDDVICHALMEQRDAEIALSPGFRWGTSLPPEEDITKEFIYSHTAMTYPSVYRQEMTGETLKTILEDVADNLFNADPYYQQGGDMVRLGGLAYRLDPNAVMGERISGLEHMASGEPIEASKSYVVAGWASVNPEVEGPPVWELVQSHIEQHQEVGGEPAGRIEVVEP